MAQGFKNLRIPEYNEGTVSNQGRALNPQKESEQSEDHVPMGFTPVGSLMNLDWNF
jgi:hypothetical protein